MKKWRSIIFLSILLLLLILSGICIGSVRISIKEIFYPSSETEKLIIQSIRIPRVFGSVLCGMMLSICGLVFQAVFRNPMADPYLLGVSSGASLFVSLGSLLGLTLGFMPSIPLLAFMGALCASAVVLLISHRSQQTLILSGIALSSLFSAFTTLTVYLNRRELSSVIFWNMGSFSNMNMTKVLIMAGMLVLAYTGIQRQDRTLDLMLLDESSARSLGLDVVRSRWILLLMATICTAGAVCFCGIIGFAGLLAPHIARLIVGSEHKRLIPVSALIGGCVMLASDTMARSILPSTELPVGVVTSILGAPLFIRLAVKKGGLIW